MIYKIHLTVVSLLVLAIVNNTFAQNKTIDEASYSQWKRLDKTAISQNGQWVLYNYDYNDKNLQKEPAFVEIYNISNSNKFRLNGIDNATFFANGTWIKYKRPNVNGQILMNLKTKDTLVCNKSGFLMTYANTFNIINKDKETLHIYNLSRKDSLTLYNIVEYKLFDKGQKIIYSQNIKHVTYLKAGSIFGKHKIIYKNNKNVLADFFFDEATQSGSFFVKPITASLGKLYTYSIQKQMLPKEVLDFNTLNIPDSLTVTENAYNITPNTKKIILNVNSLQHTVDNNQKEKSGVVVWKWDEGSLDRRNKQNRHNAVRPLQSKFIYDCIRKKILQLTDGKEDYFLSPQSDNYKYAFSASNTPYTIETDWKLVSNSDVYLIEVKSGKKKKIATRVHNFPIINPEGTYAIIYNSTEKKWYKFNLSADNLDDVNPISITSAFPYALYNEAYDMPGVPEAYGVAGWLNNGSTVLIYDKYDIWAIDLTGRRAVYSITQQFGRTHHIVLRLSHNNPNQNLNLSQAIFLNSFNEKIKAKGIYILQAGNVKKRIEGDFNIDVKGISENKETLIFTKENYNTPPNLWCSNLSFTKIKQVTNINPLQSEYAFGKAELMHWKNFEGKTNEGILYLPENYNTSKKYPVIVNFYEIKSNRLHDYIYPEYSAASINIPTYVSNGYVVFQPDVHFTVGKPGRSAYNAVISGVQQLIDQGIASSSEIAIQGHSWGAYETAYLIGKTHLFTCAVSAATLTNMTVDYTSLRSNGLSSMFMYEAGQCRMGKPMFDDIEAYIDNSPIFHVKNIQTPLLLLHNDGDLTVPFSQGLSMFFALRRECKPVWLLNYKGEGHDIGDANNKKDWSQKMQSFFDYYLKHKAKPNWM
tara:strand:+ start:32347 stop:34947 length:2601 start_codon:yes stop_codon:yes gene_type:complete